MVQTLKESKRLTQDFLQARTFVVIGLYYQLNTFVINMNVPDTKHPTVADVARRAGVSTATVSRVLNQPDAVRENLRRKVGA
ncbi:MAG: LacI family DNA-binding transcriptional regulator, partial [Burkholderiaceae bacterium]